MAGDRQRSDSPICFAVLQNHYCCDAYHLVASYQSLMVRWWQVSLTGGKMLSQVTMNHAITHMTMFDWPSATAATAAAHPNHISLPVEKPVGVPTGPKRGNARFSVASSKVIEQGTAPSS